MNNITKLIISFFVFVAFCGSCLDITSAKHVNSNHLGRALCNPTTTTVQQAKNASLLIESVHGLYSAKELTNAMRLEKTPIEKTIGGFNLDTLVKVWGNYDKFINKPGINSLAGKAFEYDFAQKFNKHFKGRYYCETTASLGRHGDPADLEFYDIKGKAVCKAQNKLSASEAIDAIINPKNAEKYKDMPILCSTDQIKLIKDDLALGTNKVVKSKDPITREIIANAINKKERFGLITSPKLTDNFLGFTTNNLDYYQNLIYSHDSQYRKIFEEKWSVIKRLIHNGTIERAIRNGERYIKYGDSIIGSTNDFIKGYRYRESNVALLSIENALHDRLTPAKATANAFLGPDIYKDSTILTTSDQFGNIKLDLESGTSKYIPKDPIKRQKIYDAIYKNEKNGVVLTDIIHGVKAKSMGYYQEATKRMYTRTFNNVSDKIAAKLSRAIRNGEEFIDTGKSFYRVEEAIRICRANNVVKPEIEAAIRSAQFKKYVRVGNTIVATAGSLIDVGYGVYMIYNAESQFQKGLLDADLSNYKKTLGAIQIGVGVVGLVMVFSPEPFSKIAAPIVVVVSVLVAALDMWIDHIQAQRCAARQKLIDKIEAQDRPRAIRQLLIRDMNIQCAL